MSLEESINSLTAAVEALTARLSATSETICASVQNWPAGAPQTIWQHTHNQPQNIDIGPVPSAAEEMKTLREALEERLQKGEIADTPAVQEAIKPIDPIPAPVPPEAYSFNGMKDRVLALRGPGKSFKDSPELTEKLINKHGAKTLREATDEQRLAIYKEVVEIEKSLQP